VRKTGGAIIHKSLSPQKCKVISVVTLTGSTYYTLLIGGVMTKHININFNNFCEGGMECIGPGTFRCLGKRGINYPKDNTVDFELPNVKRHPYFSQEYVCNYSSTVANWF
jgi:hypothetical protein